MLELGTKSWRIPGILVGDTLSTDEELTDRGEVEKNVIFKLWDLFRVNSSLYLIPGTTDFPATGDSPPVPLKGWLFGQSRPHRDVHADGQIQYGRGSGIGWPHLLSQYLFQ